MLLPDSVKRIIELLQKSSFKAYAVGGCVRDAIMERKVNDYDITTSALPEQVEKLLDENGIKYIETGLKHGTITAIINHEPYEITTFRKDGDYSDNRHPEKVLFVDDIKDDLSRRDFTMNAIAYNESEGYVDLFGGIKDIENKLIRTVGNPNHRFEEDALRIMRALRFSAQLGFEIEQQTEKAIFRNKELLKNIAVERIFAELKKLVLGDNADYVLDKYIEIIRVVVPEISGASVCEYTKRDYIRFAVLLKESENIDEVLKRLKVSNEFAKKVKTITEYLDFEIENNRPQLKNLLSIMGDELLFDLLEIKGNNEAAKTTRDIIEKNEPYKISDLDINGFDLMQLGFEGKEISETLESLLSEVINNPAKNDKEILVSIAKRIKPRKSIRLKNYDYSNKGAYFITICTKNKEQLLAHKNVGCDAPDAPLLVLSKYGKIVENEIAKMNNIYDYANVEKYVIMPNHIHLLISVTKTDLRGASRASHPTKSVVSTYVGTLKRFVNKQIGENIWQRSFYDHIIRDEEDYLNHLQYIEENPLKWLQGKDEYYC